MGSARVGKLREGPTAAIIAKPRAPSPPPLSQYPQLRPRSRDVGRGQDIILIRHRVHGAYGAPNKRGARGHPRFEKDEKYSIPGP